MTIDGVLQLSVAPGSDVMCARISTYWVDNLAVFHRNDLTLAATLEGKSITTVEGLASGDELHPMQQAFIQHDGFQCGYCTAGQIMSAVALLREPCGPDDDDVRECMSGNICRCGAYLEIMAAHRKAAERL